MKEKENEKETEIRLYYNDYKKVPMSLFVLIGIGIALIVLCINGIKTFNQSLTKPAQQAQQPISNTETTTNEVKIEPKTNTESGGTKSTLKKGSVFAMLNDIIKEEDSLIEIFKKNQSTEKNDKRFFIFYKNLLAFTDNVYEQINLEVHPSSYLLELLSTNNIILHKNAYNETTKREINDIVNPETKIFYVDTSNTTYPFIEINDDYLLKKYGTYLGKAWQEYLRYSKERNADYAIGNYHDDEHWAKIYVKWVDKWEKFLKSYPDFSLNYKIKKDIENIKEEGIWEYRNDYL